MSDTTQSAGWRLKLAGAALAVSVFAVLWFAAAALGTKYGLWGWQFGLGKMTIGWGPMIAFGSAGLAVIALVIGFIKSPRTQPVILALGALLIGLMLVFRLVGFGAQAASLPPIHDIQTDWSDPVRFSEALLAQRKSDDAMNPVEDAPVIPEAPGIEERWPGMGGRLVSEVQEEAESERTVDGETVPPAYDRPIEPLYFDQSPGEVAGYALKIAEDRGWDIFTRPEAGEDVEQTMIEATATTGWFGFKDDIAVRIRAVEGATRVDMRSISRVGLSDLGANARRVSAFMDELADRADGRREP
jgi:fatty-acyl-CoA synthase